ncbi:hypothetical protein [Roseibium litorale]|uniref:Uncharacterized protein n=1 Tax=Roseibium litorale TaxID=2803841 RepID=A0ABR9CGQ6_9HYPH|nr:hypothetical protein [Roseibium litorale]MBD8890055.1 hypothetical protein [Roseibium litorale]
MNEFENVPLPPAPRSLNDIIPPVNPFSDLFPKAHLKDVIADPLHAYIKQTDKLWENYDRRNLVLEARGRYVNRLAARVTPQTPVETTVTITEGISTSREETESFAISIGVMGGVMTPGFNLGASISTMLTSTIGRSITISNSRQTATKIIAASGAPEAVVWVWQLDASYTLFGDLVTWDVTSSKGIGQLTGKNSRPVMTRDGEGRERDSGEQVRGARRRRSEAFSMPLQVNEAVYVYSAFPNDNSVSVSMETAGGEKIAIKSFTEMEKQLTRLRAEQGEQEDEAA